MNNHLIKSTRRLVSIAGIAAMIVMALLLNLFVADSVSRIGVSEAAGAESGQADNAAARVTETPSPTPSPTEAADEEDYSFETVAELMDFLADDDPSIGPEDASVVIVEFSDYACPFCGKFYLNTLPLILEAYPDEVKYVHRDFPIFGDVSFKLAVSVDCALEQDKFWDMHRAYLEVFSDFDPESMGHGGPPSGEGEPPSGEGGHDARFDYYTDEQILELAESAGLELDSFSACLDDMRYEEEVYLDYQIGTLIGIQGVPFFIINGRVVNGAQSFEVFQQVIEQSLAADAE